MPGFGSGPFGDEPFGEFDWARRVLYYYAPVIYRNQDVDRLFELYARGQSAPFTDLRRKIRDFFDLRDPRAVRTEFDQTQLLLLGAVQVVREPVQQSGLRGSVSAVGAFVTERGRFGFGDIGKELTVRRSTIAANNRSVVITSIVDSTTVLTNPPLLTDAGPLRWEVRPVSTSPVNETIVEVVSGDVTEVAPGWILTDGLTEFVVSARTQFYDVSDDRKLLTEKEGEDGLINSSGRFVSATADFQQSDVGKRITLAGSTALPPTTGSSNTGKFTIVERYSSTEVLLDSVSLFEDLGPLEWAVLRRPQLVLEGASVLRGVVEQEGEDLTVNTPTSSFESLSAEFSSADVGKLVTVYADNDVNNGIVFEVAEVLSRTQINVLPSPSASGATYRYELRASTSKGDTRQVEVRAPSLIRFLAQDFGIEADNREEEEFQRRWVESVSNWIGLKGTVEGYQYLAELTGYDPTTVTPLYRVSQEIYEAVDAAGGVTHAIGEGPLGTDGSLDVVSSLVHFSTPTGSFSSADIGRSIEISGTSGTTNDGLYTVDEIVSPTEVAFRPVDTMTGASDGNNGSIVWRVVRLYSEEAPTIPVHDEINADRMEYLKTSSVFTIDKYCWEQSPSPWSTLVGFGADGLIEINSVDPSSSSAFPQTYTIRGQGDFDVVAGLGEGRWKLTSFGTEYFLETVPRVPLRAEDVPIVFDTSTTPFEVTGALGVFSSVTAGDILEVTGDDPAIPDVLPGQLLNGWRVGSVSGDGSTLTLDASYTLASTSLVSDTYNCLGDVIEVFNDGTAHSGVDGSLTSSGPARLTIASVGFDPTFDNGKRALVFQSGSGNNQRFILDTYVSGTEFDLDATDTPVTPDANNGSLTWALVEFEFTVVATSPPSTGVATIEYLCPEILNCDYCKSNRVLIETSTPYALEGGVERLRDRIRQVTPKHVEVVEAYGVRPLATLTLSASGSSSFP